MKRVKQSITPTDKNGNAADPTAQANAGRIQTAAYQPIEPGYFNAVVTKIEIGKPYRAGAKGFPNPNSPDGKWNYEKIVPQFTLLNENGTQINRQDFTLGVYENEKFIRPDGKNQSPIWAGTQFLLTALGLFQADEKDATKFNLDVNFELVADRVVRVHTGLAAYAVTPRINLDSGNLDKLVAAIVGKPKYSFQEVLGAVEKFNTLGADALAKLPGISPELSEKIVEQRLSEAPDEATLKLKNTINSAYPLEEEEAEQNGWFYEKLTGSIFTTAAAWEQYQQLDEADRNYVAPSM